MPTIFARPSYSRREVPTSPDQLAGWLRTELSNIQRAVPSTRSRTVMDDGPIKATDFVIYADASHGAFTLRLPSPDQVHDLLVTVKKIDAANAVTISGPIDGAASYVLAAQYDAVTIACSGDHYYVVAVV